MKLLVLFSKIVMYMDQALHFLEEHTETTREYCFPGHTWKMLLRLRVGRSGHHRRLVSRKLSIEITLI